MPSENHSDRRILAQALAPGKDCPPIERFEACVEGGAIPPDLAGHLESCAYCRTELELWRSFHTPPRDEAEAEAVRLIAERLQNPRMPLPMSVEPWWRRILHTRWSGLSWLGPAAVAAAALLIVVAVGIQWRHGVGPHLYIPDQPEPEVLRSGSIKVISPSGDTRAIPDQVQWERVAGAAQYRVGVLEVDHTELWTATTPQTRLDLPASVKAKIVPAKTILVQVVAFDSTGRKLAESEFVRFRLLQTIYNR
jgi:hypothetical protein